MTQKISKKKKLSEMTSDEIFKEKTTEKNYNEHFSAYVNAWEKEHGTKVGGFGFRSLDYSFYMQHKNDFTINNKKSVNKKTQNEKIL